MDSRYFKKIDVAYCEKRNGSILLADSYYDYKFSEKYDDFVVHVFMIAKEQPHFITMIIDKSLRLTGASENIESYIFGDRDQNYQKERDDDKIFGMISGCEVSYFIPGF